MEIDCDTLIEFDTDTAFKTFSEINLLILMLSDFDVSTAACEADKD